MHPTVDDNRVSSTMRGFIQSIVSRLPCYNILKDVNIQAFNMYRRPGRAGQARIRNGTDGRIAVSFLRTQDRSDQSAVLGRNGACAVDQASGGKAFSMVEESGCAQEPDEAGVPLAHGRIVHRAIQDLQARKRSLHLLILNSCYQKDFCHRMSNDTDRKGGEQHGQNGYDSLRRYGSQGGPDRNAESDGHAAGVA